MQHVVALTLARGHHKCTCQARSGTWTPSEGPLEICLIYVIHTKVASTANPMPYPGIPTRQRALTASKQPKSLPCQRSHQSIQVKVNRRRAPGGKLIVGRIPDNDDIKGALVLFLGNDCAHTASVAATRHHAHLPNVKPDKVGDLVGVDVIDNCVVGLQQADSLCLERCRMVDCLGRKNRSIGGTAGKYWLLGETGKLKEMLCTAGPAGFASGRVWQAVQV